LTEIAGTEASVDRDAGLVTVPVPDPSLLRTAFRRFDEAGITVLELALRRPSLDEVFFALTGHPAEDPAAQTDREGSRA
jgi:oleandomycin transport system ATP-binding protein